MSEYIVTARKWRPMRFDDVVGQGHVTTTLQNAVAAKRLAHAYLFSGPRGVGKTTVARLLAKVINCRSPLDGNPDNECDTCKEITEGRSFDVLEIDGASNRGVEEIRNLRESVKYPPTKGMYRVYIIDEVHMLTKEAFNALLKTLEEPPSHVLFIFATTEIHKVPATIVSRCQRFAFRRITIGEIVEKLRTIAALEGIQIESDALLLVAKKGDGSLRDAQSIFDQAVSLCGRTITHAQIGEALNIVDQDVYFAVTDLIKSRNAQGGLALVENLMNSGHDLKEFLGGLTEHFRNLLIAKVTCSTDLIETSDVYKRRYADEAKTFSVIDLLRLQRLVNGTEAALRWTAQPRFKVEADVVQLITTHRAADVAELLEQVEAVKTQLAAQGTALPSLWPAAATRTPAQSTGNIQNASQSAPGVKTAFTEEPGGRREEKPSSVPKGNALTPVVSEHELLTRWPELISDVRKQRPAFASTLESATPLGLRGAVVRIGCPGDFEAASIRRNKEYLAEALYRLVNFRLAIETEIRSPQPGPSDATPASGSPNGITLDDDHPVIKAIKRELGAEPL